MYNPVIILTAIAITCNNYIIKINKNTPNTTVKLNPGHQITTAQFPLQRFNKNYALTNNFKIKKAYYMTVVIGLTLGIACTADITYK